MNQPIHIGFFIGFALFSGLSIHLNSRDILENCQHHSLSFTLVPPINSSIPFAPRPIYLRFVIFLLLLFMALLLGGLYYSGRRKKNEVENQLKILKEENADLYNNAPCGYCSLDDQGSLLDMNITMLRWLGYEPYEVFGKVKFTDLIEKNGTAAFEKEFFVFKENGFRFQINLNLLKKNGGELPVILKAMSKDDRTPNSFKWRFSVLDNTESHVALDQIKRLNKELEAFTYSVSHDLRAPLRSIDGYSKILQEDYADKLDHEGKRVLNVIMNNAKRMGKLIDDLLDFAHLGRKEIQRSKVNMTGMVNHIVHEFRMSEPERKIDVTVDELLTGFADIDMIRQAWINIIGNAFKYTGKNPVSKIEITSRRTAEGEICYQVKDNGVGFDMKYVSKLFGVFQRLHKIQDFSGTGVGLAIVKRIVTRHEGRVWAEGTLNEGATFYFTLPDNDGNT